MAVLGWVLLYPLGSAKLPTDTALLAQEKAARRITAEAAIKAIQQDLLDADRRMAGHEAYSAAATRVLDSYKRRIAENSAPDGKRDYVLASAEIERELYLVGLRAERQELHRIARIGQLADEVSRSLVREIDLLESGYP